MATRLLTIPTFRAPDSVQEKKPVLLSQLDAAQCALDTIRVDRHQRVFEEHLEGLLAFDGVGDRPADRVLRRQRRVPERPLTPLPEGVDQQAGAGAPRLQAFRRRPGTEFLLDPVHAPDQIQRLPGEHRMVVQLLLEIAPRMRPAILLPHRLPPRLGVSRVGAVAVADQRALEIAEEPRDMVVGAGGREVEHHFVPVAEHRPVVAVAVGTPVARRPPHRSPHAR